MMLKKAIHTIYYYNGKEVRFYSLEITGDFFKIDAPNAKASAIKATQDTTDPSKVSVDVSGLSVNEKDQMLIML